MLSTSVFQFSLVWMFRVANALLTGDKVLYIYDSVTEEAKSSQNDGV